MEKKSSLWRLALSPLIWSLHFLACYVLAAIWCARAGRDANLETVRIVISILTLLSLMIVGHEIFRAWRKHKKGDSPPPHDAPTDEDRERFLGLAATLISSLSFLAITYTGLVPFVFRSCQ